MPAFSAYQADVVQIAMDDDGMRIDELEETLERLEREGRRPKFIYTIPTFQNPAGVTMSLPRRQRLVQVARERELLVLEDNPYGLLRYEGEALPTLRSLDGGDFVIYLGTFSKILSPGIRLGWTVAPAPVLEKMNLGKQASDLCSSSLSQLFVAAYFAEGHWQDYIATLRDLYRRRRDTMLDALAEHLPPEAAWTHPAGGLFIWATLPDYIDTTDLLALGLSRNVAFVPGPRRVPRRPRRLVDAAELLRRGRRRHPRGRAPDRRGRARAGRALRHAHRRGAASGGLRAGARARRPRPGRRAAPPAPRRSRRAPRAMSTVAVLKGGRSLERQVSLRSGARVQDALERLGHEVVGIDVGHDLVARLREVAPDVAFVALHGRDGEDGIVQELLEVLGIPYTASGVSACMRCSDKVVAKHAMRDAGLPTPDFYAFTETAFKELGAGDALGAIEDRLRFPIVVKPADQGSALGIRFAATAADVPAAIVAAFSYSEKVLLERHVHGRELAVSILGDEALPIVEAVPREEDFYDFAARYTIGRTSFVCPAELGDELTARAQELALDVFRLLGCRGFARVDLMLEEGTDELYVLESNVIPGLTETSLLPQAAEAAGISFDELIGRIVELALVRPRP